MAVVTIHQPEHMVWLGLLDKIAHADIFVVFDNVQYKKNYFENRNKIRTKDGWQWITVPVKKHHLSTNINQIEISYEKNWKNKYLDLLKINYKRAPHFAEYFSKIEEIVNRDHKMLVDLNFELLTFAFDAFGIKDKKIIKASTLPISADIHGSALCLEICKHLKADTYLSGPSGKDYLEEKDFKDSGINLVFHDFKHPEYKQIHDPFMAGMSFIDALFNHGQSSKKILFS